MYDRALLNQKIFLVLIHYFLLFNKNTPIKKQHTLYNLFSIEPPKSETCDGFTLLWSSMDLTKQRHTEG